MAWRESFRFGDLDVMTAIEAEGGQIKASEYARHHVTFLNYGCIAFSARSHSSCSGPIHFDNDTHIFDPGAAIVSGRQRGSAGPGRLVRDTVVIAEDPGTTELTASVDVSVTKVPATATSSASAQEQRTLQVTVVA